MERKRLLPIILLCLLLCSQVYSQKIAEDDLPMMIVAMHYKLYPNSNTSSWTQEKLNNLDVAKAKFTHEGVDYIVKYNLSGKKLEEQVFINLSELYPGIHSELEAKYSKYKVISLAKSNTFNSGNIYTLYLKVKGKIIEEVLNEDMKMVNPKAAFAGGKSR